MEAMKNPSAVKITECMQWKDKDLNELRWKVGQTPGLENTALERARDLYLERRHEIESKGDLLKR
jgi:hypothetical protein